MTSTPESRRHDKALAHYEPQLRELLREEHYKRMLAELTGQTIPRLTPEDYQLADLRQYRRLIENHLADQGYRTEGGPRAI